MKDYQKIKLGRREMAGYLLEGLLLEAGVVWLFYNSAAAMLLLSPCSLLYLQYKKRKRIKEQLRQLNEQFKEGIQALSAAMNAGYSIENSFAEAVKDLSLIYEPDADIMREFTHFTVQLRHSRTVEELLGDLADRSRLEDIHEFTEVFIIAKRSGGSLLKIIRRTVKNISEKGEVRREIETILSGKKLEARIMSLIPLGIIAYMRLSAPGFLNGMYHNLTGILIMTGALILYGGACYLLIKIADIQV